MKLEEKLVRRAKLAFDELVNKLVDEINRVAAKTWFTLRNARRARLQPDHEQSGERVFSNIRKIGRDKVIGPWKWWSTYGGSCHAYFVHAIAMLVLNIRCNASATARVISMHKHVVGLRICCLNNDWATKLVYNYVNSRAMKRAREV